MHKRFFKEWRKYAIVRISVVLRTQKRAAKTGTQGVYIKTTHPAQLSCLMCRKIKKEVYCMRYGVGYHSKASKRYGDTNDKCYLTWRNMLKRCYSTEAKYKNYRELGITVCDEWLDFSVFEKWFDRNYYEVQGEEMQLDKDILNHGNTMYSPENCIFVPRNINALFIKSQNRRGNLPIGVSYSERYKCYMSYCSVYGKNIHGRHKDIISAFERYKQIKEDYIKTVAKAYLGKIPDRLYAAMMNYEVRITD